MRTQAFSKTIILVLAFVASLGSGKAQKLIMPSEVTPQLLKNICEDAAVKVDEVKDIYIKVKETFSIYLDIDEKKRFIYFNINYPLVEGTSTAKALELVNKLNREIILIRCYYNPDKNTITYGYDFWIENGFTNRTFINVLKMYSKAISLSLDKDTDKLIK